MSHVFSIINNVINQARAMETLRLRGIELKLNARVTKMEKNRLFYQTKNMQSPSSLSSSSQAKTEEKEREIGVELRFGLCVWAAGTAPRKITQVSPPIKTILGLFDHCKRSQ